MLITRNEFEDLDKTPWDAPYWEGQDAENRIPVGYEPPLPFPGQAVSADRSPIRPRLHVLCALYAHSRQLDQRLGLLEDLEALVLQRAQILAAELLRDGWRPSAVVTV
jgi:hypothetical protein